MKAGLIIRNSKNEIVLDMTTQTTYALGKITTGTSNGSQKVDGIYGRGVWVYITYVYFSGTNTTNIAVPNIYAEGDTIYWNFDTINDGLLDNILGGVKNTAVDFIYGVY